jgi:hypothetical protein
MSGKSGVHVSTSFSFLVYRWMNAAGRWADSIPLPTFDSATTSVWYANDVIVILGIASVFPSKINQFNLKRFEKSNEMFQPGAQSSGSHSPKKTERISLPHWLTPTCAHCSASNNWAYRVERGTDSHLRPSRNYQWAIEPAKNKNEILVPWSALIQANEC